jgi:hypothetical protein
MCTLRRASRGASELSFNDLPDLSDLPDLPDLPDHRQAVQLVTHVLGGRIISEETRP